MDARLDALAQRFNWLSPIESSAAPGFHFVGGELQPAAFGLTAYRHTASLSGKGLSVEDALAGCIGEGAEHLSRLEWGDEPLVRGTARSLPHGLCERELGEIAALGLDATEADWMPAVRASDGSTVLVPAAMCLRRPQTDLAALPFAISTGCAAGPTADDAMLSALLELVERDAVALWWMGGRRGRPLGLDTIGRTGVVPLLQQLREDRDDRTTWLLDLTTDLDIPCVAAISVMRDGRGFACGTAARPDIADAIRGALLELCQSELGHELVAAKRDVRGMAALNEVDHQKLQRGARDAHRWDILHPAGLPVDVAAAGDLTNAQAIAGITRQLSRIGIDPCVVDLTRAAVGIPVLRVIAPGLQPFPSRTSTARLIDLVARFGDRATAVPGIPLF